MKIKKYNHEHKKYIHEIRNKSMKVKIENMKTQNNNKIMKIKKYIFAKKFRKEILCIFHIETS